MKKIKRKQIPAKVREKIYDKFNHKCAYCGCDLAINEMQIDHFIPFRNLRHGKNTELEVETEANYFSSCRMCNYYKRGRSINSMRKDIEKLHVKLQKLFLYRLALRYGIIKELPQKVVFYYEKEKIV